MYYGWTNRETWLMVLHHGEDFAEIAREYYTRDSDVYEVANALKDDALDITDEPDGVSWAIDIFWDAIERVDWVEIAKATLADLDE